jgi:hypothetical protein
MENKNNAFLVSNIKNKFKFAHLINQTKIKVGLTLPLLKNL